MVGRVQWDDVACACWRATGVTWHGEKRMGDELATVDTEAETGPETEPAASPDPQPLPEGAQPVEGVTGYKPWCRPPQQPLRVSPTINPSC